MAMLCYGNHYGTQKNIEIFYQKEWVTLYNEIPLVNGLTNNEQYSAFEAFFNPSHVS